MFYGVACNSADEVALAAEIPLSETERGVLSAAVIAEAVTGSDWLIKHDREVKAEALREAADELTPGDDKVDDWGIEAGLLRARADRIEKGDE